MQPRHAEDGGQADTVDQGRELQLARQPLLLPWSDTDAALPEQRQPGATSSESFGKGGDPASIEGTRRSMGSMDGYIRLASSQSEDAVQPTSSDPSKDEASAAGSDAEELAQIAEALANPLSYLWLMFTQNDTIWYDGDIADALGEKAKAQNTFLLNPVASLQLTENWKTIIRPVIPINSFETVGGVDVSTTNTPSITGVDFDRKTGLGDIVLWTAFSNSYTPPFVYGFGPTVMLDTATDEQLGTGKFSAGPMGLAVAITEKWIYGAVGQHWWSFAGDDEITIDTSLGDVSVDRADVNLTDIQPILRYRYSAETNIGLAPNWRYNWETDQLTLPIGMGADTLVKFGRLPVKLGLEAYYYVETDDDFGPEWQLRLLVVPVLPAPEWSRSPIF